MALNVDKALALLWPPAEPTRRVYALLDSACDEAIYDLIASLDAGKAHCLLGAGWAELLAAVAPYLVPLERDDALTRALLREGWGKSWGIYLDSGAPVDGLLEHCRGLLHAYDDEQSFYFRYYDPRVLREFIPSCSEQQLRSLTGAVAARYWAESADGSQLLEFPPLAGRAHPAQ